MARTPVGVGVGRLSIEYNTYGKPHHFRVYTVPFGADPGVGTFDASGTPASLDALALDLCNNLQGIINSAAAFSPGAWIGEKHIGTGLDSWVPVVTGNVGTITTGPNGGSNSPGAPSSSTYTFRDPDLKQGKMEVFGAVYVTSVRLFYFDLSDGPKTFADYVLGSSRIVSRAGMAFSALVSNTYDTNDALQGRYRR